MAQGSNDPTERYGAMSAGETGPPTVLSAPDADRLAALETLVRPGRRIGDYRVVGMIGRGGMGVVVLAEQVVPVTRQVALKLMAGRRMDARALTFFEVERQLLARMQHPAIAQIFDAGTTSEGIPYFSMELVEGEPLTRFADSHRLDFRERVALFRRVCLGVQHAHTRGIVHRDLKPANILVAQIDGQPAPKIIDFGIASLRERQDHSRVPVAGTAPYMSPEQVERTGGELEPRSDVYALGVVLFELLTGERPHAGPDDKTQRTPLVAASAHGPVGLRQRARALKLDPGKLARLLKGDIAAVMLKAVALDPDRRYPTAQALADDLQALLEHRPVAAVPRGWTYRARLFLRRHRLAVSLSSIALLALVLGLIAILTSWRSSALARDRALAEARTTRAVADFVSSRLLDDSPALDCDPDVRQELGRSLRQALADVEDRFPKQPLVRARIRALLSGALLSANLPGEALSQMETARREIREVMGERSREALEIELNYAGVVQWNERYADARQIAAQVEETAQRRYGANSAIAIQASILGADIDLYTNQLDRARATAERLLPLAKALRDDDGGVQYQSTVQTLTSAWRMAGNYEQAARYARMRATDARRRHGDWSRTTLFAWLAQAEVAFFAGDLEAARKYMTDNVLPVTQYYCDGLDPPFEVSLQLGLIDNAEEKYAEALPHLEAADRALRVYNGEEELMSTALVWAPLSEALIGLGRASEAVPKLLAADRILARDLGEDDADRQDVFVLLAWAYEELEQPAEQARWQVKVIPDASANDSSDSSSSLPPEPVATETASG